MRARTPIERAADYQEQADQMRRFAAEEENPEIRADLLAIAERYQSMADKLVRSRYPALSGDPGLSADRKASPGRTERGLGQPREAGEARSQATRYTPPPLLPRPAETYTKIRRPIAGHRFTNFRYTENYTERVCSNKGGNSQSLPCTCGPGEPRALSWRADYQ